MTIVKEPKKISGYDYHSWDKFDVNKAIEEVDRERESSSEYETDEEWNTERKYLAEEEKEKGNEFFRRGEYNHAIEHYSRGQQLDPANPFLPANRAMALIKQKKFAAAEVDATTAISLDPMYIKAYMRRASALVGLSKFEEARTDYQRILNLDPQNKLAKAELEKTEKELGSVSSHAEAKSFSQESGVIIPLHKSSDCRSKKSLRRIVIKEVENISCGGAGVTGSFKQNKSVPGMIEKDNQMLQNFVSDSVSLKKATAPEAAKKQGDVDSKQSNAEKKHSSSVVSLPMDATFSPSLKDISRICVPQTSFQFLSDYKVLKQNKEAFFHYFKRISPSTLPALFGEMIDSATLVYILEVFNEFYIPAGEDFEEHLVSLTEVKRFEMTALFFTKEEKQVVSNLMTHLRQTSLSSEKDIKNLANRYGV
ncbi:RNA polymerase II-associated protein 3-like isoform X2 [Haliotis asinina]